MPFCHDPKHFKWSWRVQLLFQVCPTSLRRPLQTLSSVKLILFAGRIQMETVVPNWVVPACCVLVLSGLEECWIVEHAITVCALEEYLCSVNACLPVTEWASTFSGCRHPCFTWGIWYLEDPKQKRHTSALRSFNLFNLLWGLGLQIWDVGH